MGACMGGGNNTPGSLRSKEIDNELKRAATKVQREAKVLLLGPGESGKSTVFKQMKIIQDKGGFEQSELSSFIPIVHSNCLSQIRVLIEASFHLKIPLQQLDSKTAAEKLMRHEGGPLTKEVSAWITTIWKDPGIQLTYEQRGRTYQINDTADFFFNSADRISEPDYLPTVEDVLRARVRSIGIEEAKFPFEDLTFLMVDVGGQRAERRKWIHCFGDVTAILFVAGLSGYSHCLREDTSQNTMTEALLLFDEVANSNKFDEKAQLILFLNKTDLFKEKLKTYPLKNCFPEYEGPDEFDPAVDYVREQFVTRSHVKQVVVHLTCALDTTNVRYVITTVRKKLLQAIMDQLGLVL